jgi:hypothetical protein
MDQESRRLSASVMMPVSACCRVLWARDYQFVGRGWGGGARMRGVSRRERGEGFFNRPRDACAMGAMMVMETDHETA